MRNPKYWSLTVWVTCWPPARPRAIQLTKSFCCCVHISCKPPCMVCRGGGYGWHVAASSERRMFCVLRHVLLSPKSISFSERKQTNWNRLSEIIAEFNIDLCGPKRGLPGLLGWDIADIRYICAYTCFNIPVINMKLTHENIVYFSIDELQHWFQQIDEFILSNCIFSCTM